MTSHRNTFQSLPAAVTIFAAVALAPGLFGLPAAALEPTQPHCRVQGAQDACSTGSTSGDRRIIDGHAGTATLVGTALATGDIRHVTEPDVPKVCASLDAALTAKGRTFTSQQEAAPPDTGRIQKELDRCRKAGFGSVAVELRGDGNNNAFLAGPLKLGRGVVLLIDSGVTLYGSRNPKDYQLGGKEECGTVGTEGDGCRPLIQVEDANAGIMSIRDSDGSQGSIDGRGDLTLLGKSFTWWELARKAQEKGKQNNPRLIEADDSDNFTLYNVNLVNSPKFHVSYRNGDGFTVWGVRIKTPADARNTDGIDPAGATNVTISDSYIQTGDDGIAIKGGAARTSNVTIKNSHFYKVHGISIGSETNAGVSNVLIAKNTVSDVEGSGPESRSPAGIRIKSSAKVGGAVTNVSYLDTCIKGVKAPLVFDTRYSDDNGSSIPVFTGIVVNGLKTVDSPKGTESVLRGYSASKPLELSLMNVSMDATDATAEYARINAYNSDLSPSGTGVTVKSISGSGSVPDCTFPAFPDL